MGPMRALRTGDVCPETGTYSASCGCGVLQRVTRRNALPCCLICEREVVWYRSEGPREAPAPAVLRDPPAEAHA